MQPVESVDYRRNVLDVGIEESAECLQVLGPRADRRQRLDGCEELGDKCKEVASGGVRVNYMSAGPRKKERITKSVEKIREFRAFTDSRRE